MKKIDILKNIKFGERTAEEESTELEKYFVETDQWFQLYTGNVDIVYGPKGSGKSALYTLLNQKESDLFDKNILISPAENVRGSTVFKDLLLDPPASERSFIFLWKLYCLTIITKTFREYEIKNKDSAALISALERASLLPLPQHDNSLTAIFRAVSKYFKGLLTRDTKSVEYGLSIDPVTGSPTVTRKIEFEKKEPEEQALNDIPIEEYLICADNVLKESNFNLWIVFDRLDVAFLDSPELERNALRALFRTYNDLKVLDNIKLKIFVRDDIWKRILEGGFSEASHITKTITIQWDSSGLINLVVRRLLNNQKAVEYLNINKEEVLNDEKLQQKVLSRILPDKIDSGNNPKTFDWILSRTRDGLKTSAPREVIHLFDCLRNIQIQRLEKGAPEPFDELLFERTVFKKALETVSKVKYEQTLLAEYHDLKPYLEKLAGQKAEQSIKSLMLIWNEHKEKTLKLCGKLVDLGFFEMRGSLENPSFWVPFLYRDALGLIQGKSV
ncbi:MAG TPA: hypothetical protein DDW65_10035 [Firmicutes bacterium]|jgi:hypothetical protein|nr:hypothetical protein [Bacillota bacterium]